MTLSEAVDKVVSDFITSKIVDNGRNAGTTVCDSLGVGCIDLNIVCPSCVPAYYNFVNKVANYIGGKLTSFLDGEINKLNLPSPSAPQSVRLGTRSLSVDSTAAPSVSVFLACSDSDLPSVTGELAPSGSHHGSHNPAWDFGEWSGSGSHYR
jgi:hypothetical protein